MMYYLEANAYLIMLTICIGVIVILTFDELNR